MIRAFLIFIAATWLLNAQPGTQPGTKWTEDQLRQAVAPARVGRKLTPKSWRGNFAYDFVRRRFRRANRLAADSGTAGSLSDSRVVLHSSRERNHPPGDD